MGDGTAWQRLINEAMARRPELISALTPLKRVGGYSQAAVIMCNDGRRYIVKGQQVGRSLVAEQVVGYLGRVLRAAVAEVAFVDVSAELVDGSLSVMHFEAGVGHGSLFVDGCYDGWGIEHVGEEENRERFAGLAILYGWTQADDHQLLYRKSPPHLVFSVDHGHFFAGGPEWTAETLDAAPAARPDDWIAVSATLGADTLRAAVARLARVADADIAYAVALPLDSWGLSLDERIALARYLARRRNELLATISPDR